jgi:hypothetical protein
MALKNINKPYKISYDYNRDGGGGGGALPNGGGAKSCLDQVFNFKLGHFVGYCMARARHTCSIF